MVDARGIFGFWSLRSTSTSTAPRLPFADENHKLRAGIGETPVHSQAWVAQMSLAFGIGRDSPGGTHLGICSWAPGGAPPQACDRRFLPTCAVAQRNLQIVSPPAAPKRGSARVPQQQTTPFRCANRPMHSLCLRRGILVALDKNPNPRTVISCGNFEDSHLMCNYQTSVPECPA